MTYFENPKQAVELIKTMLLESEWEKLSRYYDLRGTDDLDPESLKSGDFFIRKERPEATHPGEFWKYKRPFSPQFNYLSQQEITVDTVEVTVQIEIDQGGGMIQRGIENFYLKKSTNGYQVLPKSPTAASFIGASDIVPVTLQPPPPPGNKPDWEE